MRGAEQSYLVVGADGLVGSNMVALLERLGARVTGTSRRKDMLATNRIFLDLADERKFKVEEGSYSCAFLSAGITSIATCEAEPERTRQVNVINTIRLVEKLYAAGTRIVFLSSNAVFDGKTHRPEENAGYHPSTEYGRQKVEVERHMLSLSGGAGSTVIVRLSKTLSSSSGMAAEFLNKFAANKPCRAFDDLRMSPISLEYALESLLTISKSKLPGIFHLSGLEEMTYAQFASRLAAYIGVDPDLVRPCSSMNAGVKTLFRPEHPALGMKMTNKLLEITPEHTKSLLTRLVGQKELYGHQG